MGGRGWPRGTRSVEKWEEGWGEEVPKREWEKDKEDEPVLPSTRVTFTNFTGTFEESILAFALRVVELVL